MSQYKITQVTGHKIAELSGPGLDAFLLEEPLTKEQVSRIEELLQRAYEAGEEFALEMA
jgi:hypothetical protein